MSNWKDIDRKLISKITFESDDIKEVLYQIPEENDGSFRISTGDIDNMPHRTPNENLRILRKMLAELFAKNLNESYPALETRCDIKHDTFQKILRERNGRNISRKMLARFVVGAKVDLDIAEEMFLCLGHPLERRNRFDYILMCALRDRDDIDVFNDDLLKYGYDSIFTKAD
mgnify:CR=1 FL=1